MAKEQKKKCKGGRKKNNDKPIDPLALAPLQTVLDQLGVKQNDWDLVLIGDGSGSNWQAGCGWAAVLIDKKSRQRRVFYGAMSCGTVNLAEVFPYLQAMMWYEDARKTWLDSSENRPLRVHIITDSKYAADAGNLLIPRKANAALWAALDTVIGNTYHVTWHWMCRNGTCLNAMTDELSKSSRKTLGQVMIPDKHEIENSNPERETA